MDEEVKVEAPEEVVEETLAPVELSDTPEEEVPVTE